MQTKKCSCGRDLIFLKNVRNKLIPVLYETLLDIDIQQLKEGFALPFNASHMVNHFTNCPDADKYRKKK